MIDDNTRTQKLVMKILLDAKYRGNCKRREVKCLAIDPFSIDVDIIGVGFNTSVINCDKCYREENNIESGTYAEHCFAIHAEQDLICKCGDKLTRSHVYITHKPCITCLKLLIGAKVSKVFYLNDYPGDSNIYDPILEHNSIQLEKINMD